MLIIVAAIGVLIVIPLFLLRMARGLRRRRPKLALNSLGAVSPRWLIDHRHGS